MAQTGTRPQIEEPPQPIAEEMTRKRCLLPNSVPRPSGNCGCFGEAAVSLERLSSHGIVVGCLVAFLIPARYEATVQLMPPDTQSTTGMAMLAALTAKAGRQQSGRHCGRSTGSQKFRCAFRWRAEQSELCKTVSLSDFSSRRSTRSSWKRTHEKSFRKGPAFPRIARAASSILPL